MNIMPDEIAFDDPTLLSRTRQAATSPSSSLSLRVRGFCVDLFAVYRGELIEKLVDCFAFFQTIEQVLNRKRVPRTDGHATHLLRINLNQVLMRHVHNLPQRTAILSLKTLAKGEIPPTATRPANSLHPKGVVNCRQTGEARVGDMSRAELSRPVS